VIVLDETPFYAESGGQMGDIGVIEGAISSFEVTDTQKSGSANIHIGTLRQGHISVGDEIAASIDADRRAAIILNHSATHLMHAALRMVLGNHVQQKGSLVAPDRLRFDFSHDEGVTTEQLQEIENLVNDQVRQNIPSETNLMSYDDAVESGAIALFGEKYDDQVRVLRLGGDYSVELCGGTHVSSTGDIGVFKITSEGGVASGVRRIEAVTGKGALEWVDANLRSLDNVAQVLKSNRDQAAQKVEQLQRRNKELEKELAATKQQLLTGGADTQHDVVEIGGIQVLVKRMDGADAKTLRDAVDKFKDKLQSAIVVLGSVEDGKVRLAAGVTKNNTDRIRAGDVIKPVAEQVGGKGGGRPDFAQAGGSDAGSLDAALASVQGWVSDHLG
jgi:alanyl-tRNA synthetase